MQCKCLYFAAPWKIVTLAMLFVHDFFKIVFHNLLYGIFRDITYHTKKLVKSKIESITNQGILTTLHLQFECIPGNITFQHNNEHRTLKTFLHLKSFLTKD